MDDIIPVIVQNGVGRVPDDLRVEFYQNTVTLINPTGESRVIEWQTVVVKQN